MDQFIKEVRTEFQKATGKSGDKEAGLMACAYQLDRLNNNMEAMLVKQGVLEVVEDTNPVDESGDE